MNWNNIESYTANKDFAGKVKIWKHRNGENPILLVDKPNTILYSGADVLALALAGKPNSKITHFYLGYSNDETFDVNDEPAVTKADDSFASDGDYGYLRIPLSFPAVFNDETNYDNNSVFFTVMLSNLPTGVGDTFAEGSKIFSAGLICARDPESANSDMIFSKILFTPIAYDPDFSLTVTWGVKFTAA